MGASCIALCERPVNVAPRHGGPHRSANHFVRVRPLPATESSVRFRRQYEHELECAATVNVMLKQARASGARLMPRVASVQRLVPS